MRKDSRSPNGGGGEGGLCELKVDRGSRRWILNAREQRVMTMAGDD